MSYSAPVKDLRDAVCWPLDEKKLLIKILDRIIAEFDRGTGRNVDGGDLQPPPDTSGGVLEPGESGDGEQPEPLGGGSEDPPEA